MITLTLILTPNLTLTLTLTFSFFWNLQQLYALNRSSGEYLWSYVASNSLDNSAPTIGGDGVLYLGVNADDDTHTSNGGSLVGIDATNGLLLWQVEMQ